MYETTDTQRARTEAETRYRTDAVLDWSAWLSMGVAIALLAYLAFEIGRESERGRADRALEGLDAQVAQLRAGVCP